ncbi:hypothetical protein BH10BAC3_BH10BAC3_23580 [soil metagenome]
MKTFKLLFAAASASMLLFSCQKSVQDPTRDTTKSADLNLEKKGGVAGYVYTLSNQAAGNEVYVYSRTAAGMLDYATKIATGGNGSGGGLGSQGALILSPNSAWLLAVDAGSNTVSTLSADGASVVAKSTVASGGIKPISITMYNDIVYVLNGGGAGNITGFKLQWNGSLQPIPGSTRPLSSAAAGPAQISFAADGSAVVITEKAENKIITYKIDAQGMPGAMHSITSAHPTPFGFAVGKNNIIYVSEAAGGAPNASAVSSYYIGWDGSISLVSGPIFAGESAACWVVVVNNGKYLYATNTASNTISTFAADHTGVVSVSEAVSAQTGAGPIDAALSENSKYLYELNSGAHNIMGFAVANDGSLSTVNSVGDLPASTVGLAAK